MLNRLFLIVLTVAALGGCASLEQFQSAMNDIDQFWGDVNRKTLRERGVATMQIPIDQAARIVDQASKELGYAKADERAGAKRALIYFAKSPKPFSDDEFNEIRSVEEPMMQAMAAKHVGSFTSNFFYLSSGEATIVTTIYLTQLDENSTQVNVDFRVEWPAYMKKNTGLLLGQNPPPEAVKRGLDKFWAAVRRQPA